MKATLLRDYVSVKRSFYRSKASVVEVVKVGQGDF